jgi:hypothetical protein
MQKFLSQLLILLIVSGLSGRTVYASTDHIDKQISLEGKLDDVPTGTLLEGKRKDHSEVAGKLVWGSEEGFELKTPQIVEGTYAEVSSVSENPAPYGQVTPSASQTPPHHHSHHVRNIVIGVVAMCALAVIFAVAAK